MRRLLVGPPCFPVRFSSLSPSLAAGGALGASYRRPRCRASLASRRPHQMGHGGSRRHRGTRLGKAYPLQRFRSRGRATRRNLSVASSGAQTAPACECGFEAQSYANQGWFVLATYKNHRADLPGHIAIVRPSDKDAGTIAIEGPQITQAGATNYRSVALGTGFADHPSAWAQHEVRFYAHAVQPAALNSASRGRGFF